MKQCLLWKKSVIRLLLLILTMGVANTQSHGQIINYPVPAQALTHGYGTSLLTVQIAFSGACTSTGVKILLPPSVTYVPGSITKTGGSLSNTITEASITNLSLPNFTIGNVSGAGDITFTIQRTAGCGSLSSGKDTIQVTSGCGIVIENGGNLNNYSVYAPSLALTPPAAVNNAVINSTYTRTTTITNGGNGCLDTLRFYMVYPNAGITLTSAGNSITANGVAFTPYATGGDTLYYKIFGGTVFGGDNTLCNGEVVTITEPIKVKKCGAATYYGTGWGKDNNNVCQWATGTTAITMANGVPSISSVYTRVQAMNWCQTGIFTVAYTNNGSSTGIESAAYNLVANLGYNGTGNATVPAGTSSSNLGRIDSVKIGSVTVSLTAATSSVAAKAIFSALTADPDGAGTGLDDLDGDGQYDDLGSGKTVTITVYEHWVDNSANCPITTYRFFNSHTASYTTMCGTAYTTNPLSTGANSTVAGAYSIQTTAASVVLPAEVTGNNPFSIQICMNLGSMFEPSYKPKDSLFMDMVLPTGMSLSGTGNITYNGTAITTAGKYYVDTVGGVVTLHIARKGKNATFCIAATLVYDCTIGGGGVLSPNINIYYVGDNCAASKEGYLCGPRTINARCPSPCPDGIRNYQPIATRLNLGYTDQTLATKVTAATVIGLAKYTALPLDTIQIVVPGKQFASLGLFTNLYYNLQFGKIASTNVFQYLDGTFNQKTAITTISNAIGTPTDFSTTTLQKMRWNLSSNLGAGIITTGDSVWLVLRFAVTRANADKLYGNSLQQVPNTSSTLYNINAASANVGCDTAHQINLLISGITASNYTPEVTLTGCSAATTSSNLYLGNSTGLDIFPNEYRPQSIVDSIAITLPAGYVLFPTTNTLNTAYWPSVSTFSSYGNVSTGVVVDRGNNKWVIQNPNLATGGWRLADFGNSSSGSYPLGYSISPTCASVTGSQAQSLTWYYRDFVYTNPSSYVSKTLAVSANLTYNTTVKPAITIQNNTGTINGVLTQHNWQVQINSTGNGTASYVWMALNTSASNITIDSVVYNNAVVPAISYGAGKVWYQLNAAGIPAGSNNKPTIYFKYSSCNADSIQMLAGWNCPGYPTSPDVYVCNVASQYLKILPQPSQVQLSISRAPGNGGNISLCNTDSVTVIMNSAQSANLVAPKVTLLIPNGISIVTPIPVEYPLGSGIWKNITPTAISGGYSIDLTQHSGIGTAGLPGTATNPASAGRQAKIKVAFSTSCAFTSGSQFDFYGYGNSPCGSPATGNGSDVRSGAVNITGATTSAGMAMSVSVPVTSLTCGGSTTLTFSSTPLITGTQTGDSILYNLPVGLAYNGNFQPLANCTTCGVRSIPGSGGINQVKIGLMPGVAANTGIRFSFDVIVDRAGCGQTSVNAQAERTIAGLSCGAMNCGQSQTVIGTATSTNLSILKPDITLNNISIAGNQNLYPGGTLALVVNYTNTGTIATAGNTKLIEFFMGNNTTPFATRTLTKTLAVSGAGVDTFSVTLPPTGTAGDLITGKVQTTTAGGADQCVCSTQSFKMLGTPLPIALLSFTANLRTSHSIDTHWDMATEQGFSGYTVQRSTDGVSFTAIANVATQGHTDKTSYTITDAQLPLGVNTLYYRLELYSTDGSHSYSTTATVQLPASSDDVTLAPNPAKDQLHITLPQQWQQPVHILITDFVGRQVLQQDANGTSSLTLDISQLPGGLYTVTVQDAAGQERISKKLSVIR